MSGGEAEGINIKRISVCFLVCAGFLLLLTGCGGVKVGESKEEIEYNYDDNEAPNLSLDKPKDTKTVDVDYKSNIEDVDVDIQKIHFSEGKIGLSISFKNTSEDEAYLVSPATFVLRVNSAKTLGSSELVFVDYNSDDITMDAKDDTFKSISYWSLGDVDYEKIKEIELQVQLSKGVDPSNRSLVRFNRTINF
ncbi:hypothetical protein [Bacillus pumilus]|uniref:hypothetical protein n=1 Tax=Bacillus pumilus TaxID=1408 RepID=UPI00081FBCF9|nr:hypothetical protein [Bacillus pumilus]AOC55347.1 hypothetical protein BEN31_00355 [Bacillus pumilus]MBR0588481.1 hypothetical protein [Bacillus pumilus DW2J2]MBR0619091.1 hypothetical protein [Bacillus pumilus]MCY7724133.1 hypothetical protein [Bacillus pumilus]